MSSVYKTSTRPILEGLGSFPDSVRIGQGEVVPVVPVYLYIKKAGTGYWNELFSRFGRGNLLKNNK